MSKKFFEVFPTLEVEKRIKTLLDNTVVERVTSNRAKDMLRIYLVSDHLIQKEQLWQIEELIKKQLFPGTKMEIKFQEKFLLSSQYDLSNLMDEYKKSILLELEKYNHILHSMLKNAEISYPAPGRMKLCIKDIILYRQLQEEFLRIMEKIITERCGLNAILSIEYLPVTEEEYQKDQEELIRRKVAEISKNAILQETLEEQKLEETEQLASNASSQVLKEKQEGGKEKKEEEKPAYRRPQKKSDNPDVIYGKDFEDEAIPISDIIGEIGEVTIRGQIIAIEQREIRNEKTIVFFDITDFTDTMTIKVFTRNEQLEELMGEIKKEVFVKLKGIALIDKFDGELTIGSIIGIKKIKDFTSQRKDLSLKKRVETAIYITESF